MVIGPILSGIIVAGIGIDSCLLIDALTFITSIIGIAFLDYFPVKLEDDHQKSRYTFYGGIEYIINNKNLFNIVLLNIIILGLAGGVLNTEFSAQIRCSSTSLQL